MIAIIPARGGSSLKNKNILSVGDRPLIHHTIEAALQSSCIDKVVVSTDSVLIADACCPFLERENFYIRIRPAHLVTDSTPIAPTFIHALNQIEALLHTTYYTIFTLQPTSPLRTCVHINEAYTSFRRQRADSLLSVVEERHSLWKIESGETKKIFQPTSNRQYFEPFYVGNGAIFITKRKVLLEEKDRLGGKISLYVMNEKSSLDIHTMEDIKLASYYLKISSS